MRGAFTRTHMAEWREAHRPPIILRAVETDWDALQTMNDALRDHQFLHVRVTLKFDLCHRGLAMNVFISIDWSYMILNTTLTPSGINTVRRQYFQLQRKKQEEHALTCAAGIGEHFHREDDGGGVRNGSSGGGGVVIRREIYAPAAVRAGPGPSQYWDPKHHPTMPSHHSPRHSPHHSHHHSHSHHTAAAAYDGDSPAPGINIWGENGAAAMIETEDELDNKRWDPPPHPNPRPDPDPHPHPHPHPATNQVGGHA